MATTERKDYSGGIITIFVGEHEFVVPKKQLMDSSSVFACILRPLPLSTTHKLFHNDDDIDVQKAFLDLLYKPL